MGRFILPLTLTWEDFWIDKSAWTQRITAKVDSLQPGRTQETCTWSLKALTCTLYRSNTNTIVFQPGQRMFTKPAISVISCIVYATLKLQLIICGKDCNILTRFNKFPSKIKHPDSNWTRKPLAYWEFFHLYVTHPSEILVIESNCRKHTALQTTIHNYELPVV